MILSIHSIKFNNDLIKKIVQYCTKNNVFFHSGEVFLVVLCLFNQKLKIKVQRNIPEQKPKINTTKFNHQKSRKICKKNRSKNYKIHTKTHENNQVKNNVFSLKYLSQYLYRFHSFPLSFGKI